jgi:MCM6 C-terminal winged-helix domain
MLWRDLLLDYLSEFQHELTDLETYHARKKTISQVIRRMIKHDNTVILMEDYSEETNNEEKRLRLNPSYNI